MDSRTARRLISRLRALADQADEASPCLDCGADTTPVDPRSHTVPAWEWYAVHDEVWRAADATENMILCVACLEARLGRRLTPADFTDAQINSTDAADAGFAWWHRTTRLTERLHT